MEMNKNGNKYTQVIIKEIVQYQTDVVFEAFKQSLKEDGHDKETINTIVDRARYLVGGGE